MPTNEQVLSFLQTLFPGQLVLYPPQLAQIMGKSEKALKHLVDRGSLPFDGKKIGNRWCVDVFRVAEWLVQGEKVSTESHTLGSEKPAKPTRARSANTSRRTSLGGKLLEMRQGAVAAMRRAFVNAEGDEFIQEFIDALLQPDSDDVLTIDVSVTLAQGVGDVKSQEFQETYLRLADAAERVVDLHHQKSIATGYIIVCRNSQSIFVSSCNRIEADDSWVTCLDCDARFTSMLFFIESQGLEVGQDVIGCSDERVPAAWLASQSLEVRKEVGSLCAFSIDKEFFEVLANTVPVVRDAELVTLFHDAWSCLPSRLAFEIAVRHIDSTDELNQYICDAEVALNESNSVRDFEDFFRLEDELDVVWNWLRERGYQAKLKKAQ